MTDKAATLCDVCNANPLHTKWLVAPSLRVGHQWIETLVRNGQSMINLRPATLLRIAMDLVGPDLAAEGLTVASLFVGPLVVDANWKELNHTGYLGRLKQSTSLSQAVFESLM